MLSTALVSNLSLRLSSCLLLFLFLFSRQSASQTTLTVAAAADLSALQSDLASSFGKNHLHTTLRFVIESSAALAQQIENGAAYDVFLSANAAYVDRCAQAGQIRPDSVRAYAEGRLGLLWKDGKERSVTDLSAAWVRYVALPNPKLAPYGVAAQQALEHAGIWPRVQPKIIYGENVRQTLQLFESGNAEAVLTSDSLLRGKKAQLIPADWHHPILQKAGIVSSTKNAQAAEQFLRFLTGPEAQAVFANYGFGPVKLSDELKR
jgi:molybdate transport system substrate-binding protein